MLETLPSPSALLVVGFTVLSVVMASLVVLAIRHTRGDATGIRAAGCVAAWMTLTALLAASGFLDHWSLPPRIAVVLIGLTSGLVWAMRAEWASSLGDLPLKLLVGIQSFRIGVELLIHEAVVQGVASPVLTWTGWNFDIVPAISALLLAPFAERVPRAALQAWNLACAGVLCLTVGTALMAAPTPLRVFDSEPANIWIAGFPFVWLPAILVGTAWLGHIVLFRRLARELSGDRSS